MVDIVGIENLSEEEIRVEIAKGGRFVQYIWCVSILIMTFKRGSSIYFLRADESVFKKGLPFTLLTLILGWWGVPWGPIYSLQCLGKNLTGGYDHTADFIAHLNVGETVEAVVVEEAAAPASLTGPALQEEQAIVAPVTQRKTPPKKSVPSHNRGGPVIRR